MKRKVFLEVILVACLLWLTSCASTNTVSVSSQEAKPLIGDWIRTSGGYRLIIQEIDGAIKIKYINPSEGQINIHKSEIIKNNGMLTVTLSLLDTRYYGQNYDLTYNAKDDTLVGTYYHPSGPIKVKFIKGAR